MERKTAHSFPKIFLLSTFKKKNSGMTLMETLIVVALIALLASAFLASANYLTQIQKGKDAKRKSDLAMFKVKLEDYYNDNNRYPEVSEMDECGVSLSPYINYIPCDPRGKNYPYLYETDANGQWYRIYAKLDNNKDTDIGALGCVSGCGPAGTYNYGVSSNTSLETGTTSPTSTSAPSTPTATPVGICGGAVPPSCGNPQAYCGEVGTCCPGSEYIMACYGGGVFWCCPL